MYSIILTVPHYICIGTISGHNCDTKAELLADSISSKFPDEQDLIILIGNINRTLIDLNRIQSRNTRFRKRIREEIEKRRNKRIFLLDCHSFDKTHDFRDKNQFVDPEFVIIYDHEKFKQDAFKLKDMLLLKNIKVNVIKGNKNDIIEEFQSYEDITCLLLELSEDLKNSKKIDIISDSIKNWIENSLN